MKYHLPYIIFEITAACNLQCRYCYNVWKIPGTSVKSPEYTYQRAIRVLKKLFRLADVKHVTFTGGEPLLAERFEEIALFVRLKRKSVTIITNGSGGDESRYQTLMKLGVKLFELPVHSHLPEVHDGITCVSGSWDRSVRSIRSLMKGGAYVVPVVVITKMNAGDLGSTLHFIHSLGCRQIMLNRYNIGGQGFREAQEILPSHEQLRQAFREADQLAVPLGLKLSSNVCTPFCLLNPAEYPNISFGSCSTQVERMPVTMDIEGNLRLCNHSPVSIGNIFREKLSDIFRSEHALTWLGERPEFCDGCTLYDRCLGGCRAASLQAGLGSSHVDPVMTLKG